MQVLQNYHQINMSRIKIKEITNFENAFRKFKRACDKADINNRFRRHSAYEKPTTKRRRLKEVALKKIYTSFKQSIIKYKS
jgi:small subunit ribosomal protein S21